MSWLPSWQPLDTWIVIVAALTSVSCGVLGTFLVLRRMSMMGDAIAHAVLPGLVIAFLISGSRDSVSMFIGAAVVGVLTALLTQALDHWGRLDANAAMGAVFTTLFAIGLLLIVRTADTVDLDPRCVLFGAIETTPLTTVALGGFEVPRAALILGIMTVVDIAFVIVFFKELQITSFDPALATSLGFSSRTMHYLLMAIVATTAVAAFEAVGSILVVAMLIIPGAIAHLLTDRLSITLILSGIVSVAVALLGHVVAIAGPGVFGFRTADGAESLSTSTAGCMTIVAGGLFVAAAFFAPRHGIVQRLRHRASLTVRILSEDLLGLLYRLEEQRLDRAADWCLRTLRSTTGAGALTTRLALYRLRRAQYVAAGNQSLELTPKGRERARNLVRAHRLWESYLVRHLDVPHDHVHPTAMQLEHFTGAQMREALAREADHPRVDPHGAEIPPDSV